MYEVILTSTSDGPMIAFEASTGATVAQFTDSRSPCRGLIVTSQGFIAASHVSPDTGSGSIHIYNWHTSTIFHNIPLPEPVAPLAATSNNDFLFAGGISGSIHSISLPSGDIIKSFTPHCKPVSSLHLSDDESLLISGNDDGTIVVIPSFKLVGDSSSCSDPILHKWKAHSDSVTGFNTGIGIHTCTFVSYSMDCTCKFWSLSYEINLIQTVTFPCAIFGFVMDSTNSGFYAGGSDGFIYKGLMKVGSKTMLEKGKSFELVNWGKNVKSHDGSIVSLVLVNEGRNLVSASEDGNVWMWDVEKGEVIMVLGNDQIFGSITRSSISDMIVFKGNNKEFSVAKGNVGGEGVGTSTSSSGLCDQEMIKTMMKISELGNVIDESVHDKRKTIDMLESTIAMYERLLRLIHKEATKAIEEEDEGEDKD